MTVYVVLRAEPFGGEYRIESVWSTRAAADAAAARGDTALVVVEEHEVRG